MYQVHIYLRLFHVYFDLSYFVPFSYISFNVLTAYTCTRDTRDNLYGLSGQFWGQKSRGPLEKLRKIADYVFC